MRKELKENPEFFKAFPHLQVIFDEATDNVNPENQLHGYDKRYLNDKKVDFSSLKESQPFFKSLLHQHNRLMQPTESVEHLIRENERNFVEGSMIAADGPFKYLSREQVNAIHLDIDDRLKELEATGLTR